MWENKQIWCRSGATQETIPPQKLHLPPRTPGAFQPLRPCVRRTWWYTARTCSIHRNAHMAPGPAPVLSFLLLLLHF